MTRLTSIKFTTCCLSYIQTPPTNHLLIHSSEVGRLSTLVIHSVPIPFNNCCNCNDIKEFGTPISIHPQLVTRLPALKTIDGHTYLSQWERERKTFCQLCSLKRTPRSVCVRLHTEFFSYAAMMMAWQPHRRCGFCIYRWARQKIHIQKKKSDPNLKWTLHVEVCERMLSVWLGGERSVLLYEWHDIIEKKGGDVECLYK